jgi:hypothetical protein
MCVAGRAACWKPSSSTSKFVSDLHSSVADARPARTSWPACHVGLANPLWKSRSLGAPGKRLIRCFRRCRLTGLRFCRGRAPSPAARSLGSCLILPASHISATLRARRQQAPVRWPACVLDIHSSKHNRRGVRRTTRSRRIWPASRYGDRPTGTRGGSGAGPVGTPMQDTRSSGSVSATSRTRSGQHHRLRGRSVRRAPLTFAQERQLGCDQDRPAG